MMFTVVCAGATVILFESIVVTEVRVNLAKKCSVGRRRTAVESAKPISTPAINGSKAQCCL